MKKIDAAPSGLFGGEKFTIFLPLRSRSFVSFFKGVEFHFHESLYKSMMHVARNKHHAPRQIEQPLKEKIHQFDIYNVSKPTKDHEITHLWRIYTCRPSTWRDGYKINSMPGAVSWTVQIILWKTKQIRTPVVNPYAFLFFFNTFVSQSFGVCGACKKEEVMRLNWNSSKAKTLVFKAYCQGQCGKSLW